MGALREWLTALVATSVLLAVIRTLIPEGTVRKIGAFTAGLVLLATLLRPLTGISFEEDLQPERTRQQVEERRLELEQAVTAEKAELIAQRTAAYIWDKADAQGLSVSAEVRVEPGAEGIPVPVSVVLRGAFSESLSAELERELGIPRERQVWYED